MGGSQSVDQEEAEATKLSESFMLAFQSHYIQTYSTIVIARKCAVGAMSSNDPINDNSTGGNNNNNSMTSDANNNVSFSRAYAGGRSDAARSASMISIKKSSNNNDDDNDGCGDGADSEVDAASIRRQRGQSTIHRVSFAAADASSPDASFKARRGTMMSTSSSMNASSVTTSQSPNLLAGVPLDIGQHAVELNVPYDSRNFWVKRKGVDGSGVGGGGVQPDKRRKTLSATQTPSGAAAAAATTTGDDDKNNNSNNDEQLLSSSSSLEATTNSGVGSTNPLSVCPDVLDFSISPNVLISHRHKGMLLHLTRYMRQFKAGYIALHRNWHASLWQWEEQFQAGDQPMKKIDLSLFANGGVTGDASDAAADRLREAATLMGIRWDAAPSPELYPPRTVELFEKSYQAQSVFQFGGRCEYWRHWVRWLEQAAALASPYKIEDDPAHALAFRYAIDRAYNDVWRIYKPTKSAFMEARMREQRQQNNEAMGFAGDGSGGGGSGNGESMQTFSASGATSRMFADDGTSSGHHHQASAFLSTNLIGMLGGGSDVPPYPRHGGGELSTLSTALFTLLRETVVAKFVAKKAEEIAKTNKQHNARLASHEKRHRNEDDEDDDDHHHQHRSHHANGTRSANTTSSSSPTFVSSTSPDFDSNSQDHHHHHQQQPENNETMMMDEDDEESQLTRMQRDEQMEKQEEKSRRRKADAEWTSLKPYLDTLDKLVSDVSQKGVSIAWNTTMEIVKKRTVRIDCATAGEAAQAATVWRSIQEKASNVLGRCPSLASVTSLLKQVLRAPVPPVTSAGSSSANSSNSASPESELKQKKAAPSARAEGGAAAAAAAQQESFIMILVRFFTEVFSALPEALDEVIAQSTEYGASASSPLAAAGEGFKNTSFAAVSLRGENPEAFLNVTTASAATSSTTTQQSAAQQQQQQQQQGGGSAQQQSTVSATARKGSLMYSIMSRGFPKPFIVAQEALLSPEVCSVLDMLRASLQEEFAERASEFLISDSKCRATAAEWAQRRENPYAAFSVVGRVLRLHSLLFSDACYTYDLLSLQQQAAPSSPASAPSPTAAAAAPSSTLPSTSNKNEGGGGGNTSGGGRPAPLHLKEGSVVHNVKNRLDHTSQRHVREAVTQAVFSVCAVYWEGTVVRWLHRFCADDIHHFDADGGDGGGGGNSKLDILEGQRLCHNFAIEDIAYSELLQVCRDTVNDCIADTI